MRECKLKSILVSCYEEFYVRKTNIVTKFKYFIMKYLPLKKNKIVFDDFYGRSYGDNPKYIAEEIHRQDLKWDMVWMVNDVNVEYPSYIRVVKYGSVEAHYELSTAKVFIDNVRNSSRVKKKKGQIYLQTWHGGMAFKKVEGEVEDKLPENYVKCAKVDGFQCDAIISACALRSEQYRKYFWLNPKTEILEIGQPRSDVLFTDCPSQITAKVRNVFDIDNNMSIILYAPTFRDDKSINGYLLDFEKIISAFESKFNKKFVILVRLHPNAIGMNNFIEYDKTIINATHYSDIQELIISSDFLITDYSGAAFDFALMNKPVFLCTLDYNEYIKNRGLSELYQICPFPRCQTSNGLISLVNDYSESVYQEKLSQFKEVWKPFDEGKAARRAVEWIKQYIL